MSKNRLLFLTRRRDGYWGYPETPFSSGLSNSVIFVVEMLIGLGIEAKAVEVIDSNFIDREVHAYRPTHVFLESIWCPPQKFNELIPLHPNVRWIVRNHSEMPFLAGEGMAISWVAGYLMRGVEVNSNSQRAAADLQSVGFPGTGPITYLPNYYPPGAEVFNPRLFGPAPKPPAVDIQIGCFGAIRPLKNQLEQAIAAITFADQRGLRLAFHINSSRVEGHGAAVLSNLWALFAGTVRHRLVEHPWCPHDAFLDLLRKMDVVMQVSFSETFNIVAADAVACGVPVVVSPEVSWLGAYATALPTDRASIVAALQRYWQGPRPQRIQDQARDLAQFSAASRQAWQKRFGGGWLSRTFSNVRSFR